MPSLIGINTYRLLAGGNGLSWKLTHASLYYTLCRDYETLIEVISDFEFS